MLSDLDHTERLQLLRFVCSFAWTDLEVQPSERAFVLSLAERMDLGEADMKRVRAWLEVPPRPEEVDPTEVPAEHREIFVAALRTLATQDGAVDPEEATSIALFEDLTRG